MRRVSRLLLAGVIVMVPALFAHGTVAAQDAAPQQPAGGPQAQEQPQKPPPLTFDDEVALWTIGVNPNHTSDFEQVMTRLENVLRNSANPERRRQAAGWRILRGPTHPQTGQVLYTHIINPVVRGADYNVLELIFEAVEDYEERSKIYEQYRAAFGSSLGASLGSVVIDMSQ